MKALAIALILFATGVSEAQTITPVPVAPDSISLVDSLRDPENFDEQLLIDINAIGYDDYPALDFTMSAFTHSIYASAVIVPAGLYGVGWWTDDRHMAIAGMNTVLSEITAGLTTQLAKTIIRRNRPYQSLRKVRLPTGEEIGTSFPSGHSSVAWALSTSLMIAYPKWYVIVPAALYSTTVSLSRPYVGVHYPTDILVGAVIGAGSAFLIKAIEPLITKNLPSLFPDQPATGDPTLSSVKLATLKLSF